LQCYNGNGILDADVRGSAERREFEARIEEAFPLIECDNEFSQCFKIEPDCGMREF
jgi:hypothetical protein